MADEIESFWDKTRPPKKTVESPREHEVSRDRRIFEHNELIRAGLEQSRERARMRSGINPSTSMGRSLADTNPIPEVGQDPPETQSELFTRLEGVFEDLGIPCSVSLVEDQICITLHGVGTGPNDWNARWEQQGGILRFLVRLPRNRPSRD